MRTRWPRTLCSLQRKPVFCKCYNSTWVKEPVESWIINPKSALDKQWSFNFTLHLVQIYFGP